MTGSIALSYLVLGVLAVLVVATLVGEWLQKRYNTDDKNQAVENYVLRVEGWWYMVIVLSLALLIGHIGIVILFALLSFGAMREFLTLTEKRRADHRALVLSYYLILPAQYVLVYFDLYGIFSIFIPVYAFFLLAIAQAFRGDTQNYLARVSETQWALMITIYSVSYVAALASLDLTEYEDRGFLLIVYMILVLQSSDILQYLFSQWLKGRKIAPRLMQSRTWPGVICGMLSSVLIGSILYWMTPFEIGASFLMSLMLVFMGFFGSIVMRAIKRDRGVREWGHMIAGYGGVVDRLDSIMFAAPIFYHVTRYFWG